MSKLKLLYKPDMRSVILSTLLFVLAMLFFLPFMNHTTITLSGIDVFPDSDFWYTSTDLKAMASLYNNKAAFGYAITRFSFDIVWPIVYFYFLTSITVFITKTFKSNTLRRSLNLIPLLAIVFDLMENTFCSVYFLGLDFEVVAVLASSSSAIKWIAIFISFAAIIIIIVFKIFNGIKKRLT